MLPHSFPTPAAADLIGPGAGIATSVLWAATSVFFTLAGRRIGATKVNALRLAVAVALHWATFILLSHQLWPEMTGAQLWYLVLSGLIGLALCDQAMLTALVDIGPRRTLLLMTTSPLFALGFGWLFFQEAPGRSALAGIALTLGGVAWVTLERRPEGDATMAPHPHMRRGVALATFAAASQAAGFMLSKKGMGHGVEGAVALAPQSATLVRMAFGALGMIPILALYGLRRGSEAHGSARARRAGSASAGAMLAATGAVTGPFLGVWCSLIAIDRVPLGVAQTLCGLSPVLILPAAVWIFKERVSPRAAMGALVAVAGSALLFLSRG